MKLRRHRLALLTAVIPAIASLPAAGFTLWWILALALPAAALLVLRRGAGMRRPNALAVAMLLQIVAVLAAQALSGPLDKRAAIGASLLPPLVFLSLRDEEFDAIRALFLAFCTLIIGSILGGASPLLVLCFVAAAAVTMLSEASPRQDGQRRQWRGPTAPRLVRLRSTATLVGASLLACLFAFQLMRLLPSPNRAVDLPRAVAERAMVGPGRDFELGGTAGQLLGMRQDRLLQLRCADDQPLPRATYLRCGYFDIAELDRWFTRPAPEYRRSEAIWTIRDPLPGVPHRDIELELLAKDSNLAFVPAGAYVLEVSEGLIGSRAREAFRFRTPPSDDLRYRVAFQQTERLDIDDLPSHNVDSSLMELGPEVLKERRFFDEILASSELRGAFTPRQFAEAIATVLQDRCHYELREPSGPHGRAMLDFLDGDGHGFCMHFASATAICLRLLGVPCRIGVGLYGGELLDTEPAALAFGSHHAHAWVEIPYDDYGWVVFDPTPTAARDARLWPEDGSSALDRGVPPALATAQELSPPDDPLRFLAEPRRYAWLWILLAAGILLPLSPLFRRRGTATAQALRPIDTSVAREARRLLDALLEGLAKAGYPRMRHEGLEHYALRLQLTAPDQPALGDAFRAYQEVRFGGQPLTADRRTRLLHPARTH